MADLENKMLGEYESVLEASQKSYSPVIDSDQNGGSGYFDPELKARMDLWTLKNLLFSEDWVYILVDRIASKIAALPLQVVREISKSGKKIREPELTHKFQKRLDFPNEQENYYQWMYSIVADQCVTGNAILWDAPISGQIIKIPSELVQLHFDHRAGNLQSYHVFQSAGEEAMLLERRTTFSKSEIIHIRRPNPSSMYWGLSPFIPGKKSVLFNRYSTEYLNNFYVKGAQPGLVFEMANDCNEKIALRMLRSLELANTGRANQRRNMVLPKGVKSSTVEHRIADQDLQSHVLTNRETIINLLQVPKQELSIAETGSLGSEEYKTAIRNFWNGPLNSIMRSIEWAIWMHFKDELGDRYSVEFDRSQVAELQADEIVKAELATKQLAFMTPNEVRMRNYEMGPVPGGDVLQSSQPPQMAQFSLPAPQKSIEPVEQVKAVEQVEVDNTKAILEKNYGIIQDLKAKQPQWTARREEMATTDFDDKAPKMVELVMDIFTAQAEAAIKAVRSKTTTKAVEIPSKPRLEKAIKDALKKFETQWLDEYTKILKTTVDVGYDMALELPFKMPNKSEIEASRIRNDEDRLAILEERGLRTFAYLNETNTEKIMSEVTRGLEDGLTIQQISKNISLAMADEEFTVGRANTIARTEVLTASSLGQAAAMQDAAEVIPNLQKVWVNAGDDRVRGNPSGLYAKSKADHWNINGEMRDHDKPFSNGLMFPRDPKGGPGETINCFPGSTVFETVGLQKAFSRFYRGPLVTVHFKSGYKLSGTPNHPVLTPEGWVILGALNKGSKVFKAQGIDSSRSANADIEYVKATASKVFSASLESFVGMRKAGSVMDFHGDGSNTDVNIVDLKGRLKNRKEAKTQKSIVDLGFTKSDFGESLSLGGSTKDQPFGRIAASHSSIGCGDLPSAGGSIHSRPLEQLSIGSAAYADAIILEPSSKDATINIKHPRNLIHGELLVDVEVDEVVLVNISSFSGHVYNIQTEGSWYMADKYITHNCRCTLIIAPKEEADELGLRNIPDLSGTERTS